MLDFVYPRCELTSDSVLVVSIAHPFGTPSLFGGQ